MKRDGTWVSYAGEARIGLVLVLAAIAVGLVVGAVGLSGRVRLPRFGRAAVGWLLVAWVLAMATFLIDFAVYVERLLHDHPSYRAPNDPVAPITFTAVILTFVALSIFGPGRGPRRLVVAAIAALAAPWIFELPFDLVVMARTYPPVTPDPALFRALFFAPLFLIEVTTLALLAATGEARVSRWTLVALAGMFTVFALWGTIGFGYPSAPLPIAANVVAKLLAFAVTWTLVLPPHHDVGLLGSGVVAARGDRPVGFPGSSEPS